MEAGLGGSGYRWRRHWRLLANFAQQLATPPTAQHPVILADLNLKGEVPFATGAINNLFTLAPVQQRSHERYKPFLLRHRITDMDSGSGRANDSMWFKTVRSSSANYRNLWSKTYIMARPPNLLLEGSENHRCPPIHFREPWLRGLGKGNSG